MESRWTCNNSSPPSKTGVYVCYLFCPSPSRSFSFLDGKRRGDTRSLARSALVTKWGVAATTTSKLPVIAVQYWNPQQNNLCLIHYSRARRLLYTTHRLYTTLDVSLSSSKQVQNQPPPRPSQPAPVLHLHSRWLDACNRASTTWSALTRVSQLTCCTGE